MSPRTSTWTEISGSSFDASADLSVAFRGEPRLYCVGKHSRSVVNADDATRTMARSSWSIEVVYQPQFMPSALAYIVIYNSVCMEYWKTKGLDRETVSVPPK